MWGFDIDKLQIIVPFKKSDNIIQKNHYYDYGDVFSGEGKKGLFKFRKFAI